MRILLTGATGFIGRQIARCAVAAGHDVSVMSRSPQVPPGTHRVGGNFFDGLERTRALAWARPEIIIHAAWYVEHGAFWSSPENSAWAEQSVQFIGEAKRAGVRRFVGLGTCYEYAWPDTETCDEVTTPDCEHTAYDIAKSTVRRALATADQARGFSSAWARLFFLYGEGEGSARLGPSVAQALMRGEPARCGFGRAIRDFMDVAEAGRAILALALSDVRGSVNVASGEACSVADFALRIGAELDMRDYILLGAIPDRLNEPPYIVASTRRLLQEVGFQPAVSLSEGIQAFCRYQRSLLFDDIYTERTP